MGEEVQHSAYLVAVTDETRNAEKHFAAAAARNTEAILEILKTVLSGNGRILEIASGTGQHIAAFATAFPGIAWQPSDPDPAARMSIVAWCAEAGLTNVMPPLALNTAVSGWEIAVGTDLDAAICINMIHIAPWAACEGLLRGAGWLLRSGGLLMLYGPYSRDGAHTAPSNAEFDRSLRARNAEWGVRDLVVVAAAAERHGLVLEQVVPMPANNFSLLFRKP